MSQGNNVHVAQNIWSGKRVLVTGVTGFVGSYLAAYLIKSGAEVFGLVRRRADGRIPNNILRHQIEDTLHSIQGDLLDFSSLLTTLHASQPDYVFHLAAQSFVPRSFESPLETLLVNAQGTANLLEAIRIGKTSPVLVHAGSSEEYGLVFASERQYAAFRGQHPSLTAERVSIPEVPVREDNPLRPMSPYAVSKVQSDYLVRSHYHMYGLKGIVARSFNTEGNGRGTMFVTSTLARQVARIVDGLDERVVIGNVNVFRDWSHVNDMVRGLCLIAEKGIPGEVYNQGSQRTNSVVTYLLMALDAANFRVDRIRTFKHGKSVDDPLEQGASPIQGASFTSTKIDTLMLNGEISFPIEDEGLWIETDKQNIPVYFDPSRFRPAEVPILLADTAKIKSLGFSVQHSLSDIVSDQLAQFLNENHAGSQKNPQAAVLD